MPKTINPFVRELVDAVLTELGIDRTLFDPPAGSYSRSRSAIDIANRNKVYAACVKRKTRFGNTPSVLEIATDLGIAHSTVAESLKDTKRYKPVASPVGAKGVAGTVDDADKEQVKDNDSDARNCDP